MPVSINQQTIVFLSCILTGIAMGFFYDLLSGIRNGFSLGKATVFLLDSIFWLAGAIVFFSVLYYTCGGDVRWYVFVGMLLGMFFYLLTLSHIIQPIFTRFVLFVHKLLKKILHILFLPIFKILKFLVKLCSPLTKTMKSALKKQKNFVKKNVEKIKRIGILLKKV